MNQASRLDQLMNESEQKSQSIALLATSGVKGIEGFLESFALYYSHQTKKNILISDETIEGQKKEILSTSVVYETNFFKPIEEKEYRKLIEKIEEKEVRHDLFIHYMGGCLQAKPLTKARLSQKIMVIANPSDESAKEIIDFLKIVELKKFQQSISLIIDTENKEVYDEYLNTLQESSRNRMNYFLEAVGFTSMRLAKIKRDEDVYRNVNLRFLDQKEASGYSDYVERCLFGG